MGGLPPAVTFLHEQIWYIGKERLTGEAIYVLVGPSPATRWSQEGHRTKRRSVFVNVRIVSACDQKNADRVAMLMELAETLLEHVSCLQLAGEYDGQSFAVYNETTEFDPSVDPVDYNWMANNVFFTSFSLEFIDRQLFPRQ